jgi:hypothetical protein
LAIFAAILRASTAAGSDGRAFNISLLSAASGKFSEWHSFTYSSLSFLACSLSD